MPQIVQSSPEFANQKSTESFRNRGLRPCPSKQGPSPAFARRLHSSRGNGQGTILGWRHRVLLLRLRLFLASSLSGAGFALNDLVIGGQDLFHDRRAWNG